ncbi:MAG: NAD(P)-dependent glycerol-3-phosphate dehydrogenase [Nitrospinae bacterium]|nr:NAD(P)-dependent glycerol-3-phosphate dehydrogenase [Nitrospinota bacterium]
MNKRIAVIGAGSWGTTLANLLADKGYEVKLWVYEDDLCGIIKEKRENTIYLPGFRISERIYPTTYIEEVAEGIDTFIIVVPSHVVRSIATQLASFLPPDAIIINASKGIEIESLVTISRILREIFPERFYKRVATISGPTFANEVSLKTPTAVVAASEDIRIAERVQEIFTTSYFRVFTNTDLLGVELGGALKNVIAIAAGISDGLGFGYNARAALITRGLVEMMRLGVAIGASPQTLSGLSGLGDLVLTCTGDLSRNRGVGLKIGKGMKLDEIQKGMRMVAEGIRTVKSAHDLKRRYKVKGAIIDETYAILYEGKSPREALKDLLEVKIKDEFEGVIQ